MEGKDNRKERRERKGERKKERRRKRNGLKRHMKHKKGGRMTKGRRGGEGAAGARLVCDVPIIEDFGTGGGA